MWGDRQSGEMDRVVGWTVGGMDCMGGANSMGEVGHGEMDSVGDVEH